MRKRRAERMAEMNRRRAIAAAEEGAKGDGGGPQEVSVEVKARRSSPVHPDLIVRC